MGKKYGFTLIELMVAIAIIAILSSIAVPNYISYRNNQQVTRAARQVYSTLQSAKMTAIKDNATVFIDFVNGSGSAGTFRVFEDLDDNDTFDAGTDDVIQEGQMPPGVTMADAGFSGDTQAVFNSMGIARKPDGSLNFGSVEVKNNIRCSEIRVSATGSIRIAKCQ
ncbi:MAG: GspH/FimT family protein [Desulfobacterales bacterium]|nr:GspH/FimT family protein [Desulfobacterales bacterium]